MNDLLTILKEKVELLTEQLKKQQDEIDSLRQELAGLKNNTAAPKQRPEFPPSQQPVSKAGLENFIGLKLIHFVGIIVLLTGLAIGVKYAIDAQLVSPLLRIILAYSAALMLLGTSLKLQAKLFVFSIILFSGAMASAYFTTYAAFEYYSLISRTAAFILMLLFTIFTVFKSLQYNRQEIAILGLAGAYGIPFFVGNNNGSVAVLFMYMLFINAGILFISFRKYWPALTYIAFTISWSIYFTTMAMKYNSGYEKIFLLFAVVFFLLFTASCLAFKLIRTLAVTRPDTAIVIAGSLFLYVALACLHTASTQQLSLFFCVGYFSAAILSKKSKPVQLHLTPALFILSFIAAVFFTAEAFEGLAVTIVWVLMAVFVFLSGMHFRIKPLRFTAIALFAVTLVKLLMVDSGRLGAAEKIIAWIFTGAILLAVSFLYQKYRKQIFDDQER